MSGLLGRPLKVVNAGVELFAAELERQQAEVARVEWRPPADGAEGALERLAARAGEIADANDRAVAAMQAAEPRVVGIGRAGDLLPGLDERTLLHAGPPIDWAEMCGPLRGAIIGAAVHEGIAADPRGGGAAGRAGRAAVRSLPRARGRRADGRGGQRLHAGVGGRERRLGQPRVLHPQRGPRQGAPLRRLRRPGAGPAGLDAGRPRAGSWPPRWSGWPSRSTSGP